MSAREFDIAYVPVDDIFVVGNRRPLNEDAVARLMESIRKIKLRTPITIRGEENCIDPKTGETVDAYAVVAGAHRLEACRRLGHKSIPAVIRDCTPEEAEMWEIAENLHRADLTALERDEHITRWIKLVERQEEVSRQSAAKPQGGRPEGGTRAAARELGIDDRAARRAKTTSNLSTQAKDAARETGMDDNRSVLLAASKGTTPEQQTEIIRTEAAKRIDGKSDDEVEAENWNTLLRAWNKASPAVRQRFREYIDEPVMDQRFG